MKNSKLNSLRGVLEIVLYCSYKDVEKRGLNVREVYVEKILRWAFTVKWKMTVYLKGTALILRETTKATFHLLLTKYRACNARYKLYVSRMKWEYLCRCSARCRGKGAWPPPQWRHAVEARKTSLQSGGERRGSRSVALRGASRVLCFQRTCYFLDGSAGAGSSARRVTCSPSSPLQQVRPRSIIVIKKERHWWGWNAASRISTD